VREEVRAALREAMQEMHGVGSEGGWRGTEGAQGARQDRQPMVRRLVQPKVENIELRELENEMKELEQTLEQLQGEIGKKVGGQLRETAAPAARQAGWQPRGHEGHEGRRGRHEDSTSRT